MNYNKLKKELKFYKNLCSESLEQVKYRNLINNSLVTTIEEVLSFTNDNLAKKVLENAISRSELDEHIHTRLLFKDEE